VYNECERNVEFLLSTNHYCRHRQGSKLITRVFGTYKTFGECFGSDRMW